MLFAVCLSVFWGGEGEDGENKEKKKGEKQCFFSRPSLFIPLLFQTLQPAASGSEGMLIPLRHPLMGKRLD